MTTEEKQKKIKRYRKAALTETTTNMKNLGNFKEDFVPVIEKYADMLAQYQLAWEEFVESGCVAECPTKAGGVRKTAAVTTMEELRRQIGAYADRLRLTPKTNDVIGKKERQSTLEAVFAEIGKLQDSL